MSLTTISLITTVPLRRVRRRTVVTAVALIFTAHQSANAQLPTADVRDSRAAIAGSVVDDDGRAIANATVSLPSLQRRTTTNDSGQFRLGDLPSSILVLEVRRPGYQPATRRVDLASGQQVELTVTIVHAAITVPGVVVTGNPTASERSGAQDVAVVSDEQLRASGTGSIGKTLERLPGVTNMSGGPAAGNPVLRGLSQGRIRIVSDGVPQESFAASPRWFAPGNLSWADRIEVIRGPASILYGSSAIGGAINIIARPLQATAGGGWPISGLLESQYSSNNGERYDHAEVEGAANGIGIRIGAARRAAGDFRTPNVQPYSVSKLQGAPEFTGKIDFTNHEESSAYGRVGAGGAWGNASIGYDSWDGNNNFPNANGKPTGVHSFNDDIRLRGNIIAGTFLVRPSLVVQRARIQRAATVAKTFEIAADSNLWDQDLTNRIVTTRVEVEHPAILGLRGTTGAEYVRQSAVTRRSQIQPSGSIANVAAFALEEYRLNRYTLSSGIRIDERRQEAESNSLVDSLPTAERATALNQTFSVVTTSIGLAYQIHNPLSLYVSIGTGFRAPSFLDLYTNENRPSLGGWVEGNPRLQPERSTNIEAGARYASPRLGLNAVVYRNRFSDFTYLTRTTRTHLVNGTSLPVFGNEQAPARITGLELSGTAELLPAIVANASYSTIASRNLLSGEALPLMPADQLRASLRLAPRAIGTLDGPYAQVGVKHAWYKAIAGQTEPFADGGSRGYGVASTEAYTLFDAGIGTRLAIGASDIEVYFDVDNLFNAAYRDFLDTQKGFTLGAGRNVSLRVAAPLVFNR